MLRKNSKKGIVFLLAVAILITLCVPVWSSSFMVTNGDDELKSNFNKWKTREDYTDKILKCQEALEWVKSNGKFAPAGSGKGFDQAMSLPGNKSLRKAFRIEKLLGILAQESSFGTNFSETGGIVGPFQLSEDAVKDYNLHNGTNLKHPDDVNGADDFDTAAKVAAWYVAYLLQQLTWKTGGLTAVVDPEEANKFALAAYNGGLGKINEARKAAKDAGKDPNKWDDVKNYLPPDAKTTEIKEYVEKVRGYEKLFRVDVIAHREEVKEPELKNSRIELEVKKVPKLIDGRYPYRWRYRVTKKDGAKVKDFCIKDIPPVNNDPDNVNVWGNWVQPKGWKRTVRKQENGKWTICWETETPVDFAVLGFDHKYGLDPEPRGKFEVSYDTAENETGPITVPRDEPTDKDVDGVPDSQDNCPDEYNPNQKDFDQDGLGDECDPDDDNDGIPDSKDECRLNSDPQCGGDPPIYGNIMVFPTPERFLGSDLNGDGDIDDTVLRCKNLTTGEVVNTGLIASGAHHSMDIYENIIAFVGEYSKICYYNITTGTVSEIGVTGSYPSIYDNIITFVSQGAIHYFELTTQTLTDTEIRGNNPAIYENLIVFYTSPEFTIWTYDLRTGVAVNTGIIGLNTTLYETVVAFETPEFKVAEDLNGDGDTNDLVICYYDFETQTIINTGAVGNYPSIYGNRIVFTTEEREVNQDLNGDGKIRGNIISYYDLETCKVINTQQPGTEPDIYEDTITFYLWERWAGRDLDGDGNYKDPIVDTYQITLIEPAVENSEIGSINAATAVKGYKNDFTFLTKWLDETDSFLLHTRPVTSEESPEEKDGICLGTLFLALLLIGSVTAYLRRK